MVENIVLGYTQTEAFQYSLCRVVLMVPSRTSSPPADTIFQYSLCRVVLMVSLCAASMCPKQALSVLALSSRFDGLVDDWLAAYVPFFQYSLCRVVLMVMSILTSSSTTIRLSVLALSSRFDGPEIQAKRAYKSCPFSTRSVESF